MINNFRMRKYFARALLPFVALWLIFLPQRAYAFVPASIYAYPPVAAGGGAVAGTAVGALAVGAAVGYYGLGYLADKFLNVPATDKPFSKTGPPVLVAPILKESYFFPPTTSDPEIRGIDPSAVCSSYYLPSHSSVPSVIYDVEYLSYDGSTGNCVGQLTYDDLLDNIPSATSKVYAPGPSKEMLLTCPSGYNLDAVSGSGCVLVAPAEVVPDGDVHLPRDANGYQPADDKDLKPSDGSVVNPDGSVTVAGQNEQGQSQVVTVIPTPDGGSQITTQTQEFDQNGSPSIWTQTVTVNGDGVVTEISGSAAPGTLPSGSTAGTSIGSSTGTTTSTTTGTTTASTVDPVTGSPTGNTTSTTTSTTTETSTFDIQFPDDYARRGEAAASTKPIIDKLTKTSDLTDPTLPDVVDMPSFDTTFDNLLSWQLPGHSSTCPTPSMDLGNLGSFTLNSHCALFEQNGQPLRTSMNVVWSVLALFIVLRA